MSEEMNELKTRVGDINKTVGEMKALMAMRELRSSDLEKKVNEIYEFLIGSTDSNKPSMMVRLDRVEQVMSVVKWVCVVVGGLLINAIFERFKHG